MKLYISVDMEGLAGITHWKDESEERERFRKAMNQNFVPVVDDQNKFIGIITRKSIIEYCYEKLKKTSDAY